MSGLRILCARHTVLDMGDIGHAIRAIREEHELSLRELARLSGTNPTYLSQVERGLRTPSKRWLRDVTKALGEHMAAEAS